MGTGGTKAAGFTIVETLIVLAVSSVLAISAMLLVSGRQNKTEFQVAVRNLKQQLEQIINETANGYYPTNNNFACDGTGADVRVLSGSNKQGTNESCIFLGKAIAFATGDGGDAQERFTVYPLIAKRYTSTKNDVSSFADAKPIALAYDGSSTYPTGADYAVKYRIQNGLSLNKARYRLGVSSASLTETPQKPYAVFAFANSLTQYADTSSSSLQKLDLYEYDHGGGWPAVVAPATSAATVNLINQNIDLVNQNVYDVQLCFSSGGTDQSAMFTVAGGGQLTVTMKIFAGKTC